MKNGICTRCNKRATHGTFCEFHAQNAKKVSRESYQKTKDKKLCVDCRKPVENGRTLCAACSMKHSEYNKSIWKLRKEQGLCTRCGKNESMPGTFYCGPCKMNSYTPLYYDFALREKIFSVKRSLAQKERMKRVIRKGGRIAGYLPKETASEQA